MRLKNILKHLIQRLQTIMLIFQRSFQIVPDKEIRIQGFDKMIFFDSGDDKQTKSKEWRLQSENKGSSISLYRNNRKVMDLEIAKKTDDLAKEFGNQCNGCPTGVN
jgi:hypothetical protein